MDLKKQNHFIKKKETKYPKSLVIYCVKVYNIDMLITTNKSIFESTEVFYGVLPENYI